MQSTNTFGAGAPTFQATVGVEYLDISDPAHTLYIQNKIPYGTSWIVKSKPVFPVLDTVTEVDAVLPITSSGGQTPIISTSMQSGFLIGRGAAGVGVMQEITLGTNLSLAGNVLNATGGSGGIASINTDTTAAQTLTIGTSGTDFAIVNNLTGDHKFNLPSSSAVNRGALLPSDWIIFNSKQAALTIGNLTDTGTDGITIGNGTGAVIGTGTTISQHEVDSTHNGYLSSANFNIFESFLTAATWPANRIPFGNGAAGGTTSSNLTWDNTNFNLVVGGGAIGIILSNTLNQYATLENVGGKFGGFAYSGSTSAGLAVAVSGFAADAKSNVYSAGDGALLNNGTYILINDQTASQNYLFSKLAGTGTQMVVASSTGILGRQAIPGGTVSSITTNNGVTSSPNPIIATGTIGLASITGNSVLANTAAGSAPPTNPLAYSAANTASSLVLRDGNKNAFSNNFSSDLDTVASTGGATTLTVSSKRQQRLTGSGFSPQTYILPSASTLIIGMGFDFDNISTNAIIVKDGSGTVLGQITVGGSATYIVANVGSTAGVWDVRGSAPVYPLNIIPVGDGVTPGGVSAGSIGGQLTYGSVSGFLDFSAKITTLNFASASTGINWLTIDDNNAIASIIDAGTGTGGFYLAGAFGGGLGGLVTGVGIDLTSAICTFGDAGSLFNGTYLNLDIFNNKITFVNTQGAGLSPFNVPNFPTYLNDAAAGLGGLGIGDIYQVTTTHLLAVKQ